MALRVRKFTGLEELNAFLGARLTGANALNRVGAPELYLHGLTLIFGTPSATVTFAATPASTQVALSPAEIVTQIETQTSNAVSAAFTRGRLQVWTSTPGPIVVDKDGTANTKLGFATNADTSAAVVDAPGGTPPAFVSLSSGATNDDVYILATEDP